MAQKLAESVLSGVEGLKQPSPKNRFGAPAPPHPTREPTQKTTRSFKRGRYFLKGHYD